MELKENQAVLVMEQYEDGSIHGDVKSGGEEETYVMFLCEAISDKLTDETFWQEVSETANTNQQQADYEKAHRNSIFHRKEIMESKVCGCFFCMEVFDPAEIEIWTDESKEFDEQTAMCPYCFTDSVIGDKSGYPIINSFLEGMCERWFGDSVVRMYKRRIKAMYGR